MYIAKIKKRFIKFKLHPLTKSNPYSALLRYVFFNFYGILNNKPRVFNWINGLKFYAQKGDAGIVPNIYFKLFDYEDSRFILDKLTFTDVFIDVGANVGHFSLLAASKKAQVLSFEPIPETFEKLARNVKLNNFDLKLFNMGIGAKNEILNFSTQNGVMNSVTYDSKVKSKKVSVVSLDEILKDENPTMLKIDVEGFEWFVLQGAKTTLGKSSLKYILIELNNSGQKFLITDETIHHLLLANNFIPYSYDYENSEINVISTFRKDKFNTLYIRS